MATSCTPSHYTGCAQSPVPKYTLLTVGMPKGVLEDPESHKPPPFATCSLKTFHSPCIKVPSIHVVREVTTMRGISAAAISHGSRCSWCVADRTGHYGSAKVASFSPDLSRRASTEASWEYGKETDDTLCWNNSTMAARGRK